ncbi:MAG: amino acid adenylation domain-containing protein [Myxococcales bacterium]|nr:amino acid adenylation domain-containing protein [Myxococcales bacterium]USN50164.1 MAG: amino acid adenylation domain-containing protein [Myxococcales bacterium]
MTKNHNNLNREKIAIIGMGCRFPGNANDYNKFWQNLISAKDCITPTPSDRYNASYHFSKDKGKIGRLTGGRGGYIDGFDQFDPTFFGIGPREAENMDPQQRKLLEVAWEALEDGGQKPFELAGEKVGVFIGGFTLDYKIVQFSDLSFNSIAAHTATGTMMTLLSNRISYCFDFKGPSMSVDTACSSSLVSIHLACQSLQRGESKLALAGGVLLHMTPQYTVAESKGGFLSPEGKSCTFDSEANGYVRAEGVGIVVLKKLSDAIKDKNLIHGVIIGSGVNQDGRTNGITVPNPDSQTELIRHVCQEAGIMPGDLHYVEAHGTSTPVGDPLEAQALGQVLMEGRKENSKCFIGSVKTNIGHTEAAAGVAGLIKTVLSMKHKIIPPHINLKNPNEAINLSAQPFSIPTKPTPWPSTGGPMRAGVNSFGFGGTNAHVLLEEAPEIISEKKPVFSSAKIFPMTAKDNSYFKNMLLEMRDYLLNEDPPIDSMINSLARHRQSLDRNLSFVFSSKDDLLSLFNAYLDGEAHGNIVEHNRIDKSIRKLVWVFSGMGPQWWAMGRHLFDNEPVYREVIERCDREIKKHAHWSLIEELNADENKSNMSETWLAQPANFAMQVALCALWRSHGITPDAIVGHSTGEAAAFYEAGVYSFEDAVKIIIHRSRLQQKLIDTGVMLAVSLSEEDALARITPYQEKVSIAAINSPMGITLSGEKEALIEIAQQLQLEQIFAKFLNVKVPYHSPKMDVIKDDLLHSLADIKAQKAQTPLYLSGREGKALGSELNAHYWWDNVRQPVRFSKAIENLAKDGFNLFLEIGPHPVLGYSIEECFKELKASCTILASCRKKEDEVIRFKRSLAALHNLGFSINWDNIVPPNTPLRLPCYPWKKDRYWNESQEVAQIRLGHTDHPFLGRRLKSSQPSWEFLLDIEQQVFLADHRIENNIVFPAAAYIEMAFQAMHSMSGHYYASITDIEFKKALFIPESEVKPIQFIFNEDNARFSISSLTPTQKESIIHACGGIRSHQPNSWQNKVDIQSIFDRCITQFNKNQCYKKLADMGYHYGSSFALIEEVVVGDKESLAKISLNFNLKNDSTDYHFHPALLDACFQTLLTSEMSVTKKQKEGIRLPLTIKEINALKITQDSIWAHATISSRNSDEIIGDISIFNTEGKLLAQIKEFKAANTDKVQTKVQISTIDNWLTEIKWLENPLELSATHHDDSSWIIFSDSSSLSKTLCAHLKDSNKNYLNVALADTFSFNQQNNSATINFNCQQSLNNFFKLLANFPNKKFIYLCPLDAPEFSSCRQDDLNSKQNFAPYPLISLCQEILKDKNPSQLIVLTKATQKIVSPDKPQPIAASLWGICRVLWQQEMSQHKGKIIDIDPLETKHEVIAKLIINEASSFDETEVAYRNGVRYVNRLEQAQHLTPPLPLNLRADGSYLITGAFGALGKLICRTLIKRGARRLILMNRSIIPKRKDWLCCTDKRALESIKFIRELENLGAHISYASVDVRDKKSLREWHENYKKLFLPPIRGIFHLAGVVNDTLISNMSQDIFDSAYDVKVFGSANLHKVFIDEPIDHFILFASIASLLTTSGQSNYAAGNAFLDCLAHHRRSIGLPALSIDWGPWAVGMIEELGLIDHYRNSRGMSSLSPEAGMEVLERIISQDKSQICVATIIDWPLFLNWYPQIPCLIGDIAAEQKNQNTDESENFIDRFSSLSAKERLKELQDYFIHIVSNVLRIKVSQVNVEQNLNELGLDSLLAIELRARLQRELKVAPPVVKLLSSTNIKEICLELYQQMEELLNSQFLQTTEAIEVFTDTKEYPLTHNQTALWFLKHLHPDGFAYNIGGAVEIKTQLKPEIMFEAVRKLIKRHPSLRANFVQKNGRAVQCISDQIKEDIKLINVENYSWNEIYQMIIAEYRKPYDLACDPLMRFRLFKLGEDRWVMMKAVHHIISDAISTFTFIEELLELYETMKKGQQLELAPLKTSYLDFLNWQNKLLASPQAKKMLDYWLSHLPEEIPNLNLPADKLRPIVLSHNGSSHFFVLDKELSQKIHKFAQQQGVTIFMVLLSAYYTLLHRYSGQDQIIVGSPVLGRTEEEFASVYGYFVNPLPLYADLSNNPSTIELIQQVQNTVLNGLDNQEYPFVKLVDKLELKHDPSRSRVFQAMFILLVHRVATTKYGYRLRYIELPEEEGQFDLTMSAYEDESEGRFHCVFKYNSDLFFASTVERMAKHFVNLLSSMLNDPKQSISQIELLDKNEKRIMLEEWSGEKNLIPPTQSIIEMIDYHAKNSPFTQALIMPQENGQELSMNYQELYEKSNLIAARLQEMGVGCGSVLALCLYKSLDLIPIILGVLKTGAAYVPLDPQYPSQRLAYMLNDVGAHMALVDNQALDNINDWNKNIIDIRTQNWQGECKNITLMPSTIRLDDTAYIIYTSGSTGRPKAVAISHRNLSAIYNGWKDYYRLENETYCHAQLANFSFDVFAGDYTRALCSGKTLLLVEKNILLNTALLYSTLKEKQVDCVEFVPAIVRSLMRYCFAYNKNLDFIKILIVGSDAWTIGEMKQLKILCHPHCRIINSYGLTEATIDSSCFEGDIQHMNDSAMVPIGKAFKNSSLYILDKNFQATAILVIGELWIGGLGLSIGYVKNQKLTEQRFKSISIEGCVHRLYRTGDLAYWDSFGNVHLVGRLDKQIKVRGYRIEIGEIENTLKAQNEIADAIVSLHQSSNGESHLCAYVAPKNNQSIDRENIRARLCKTLPVYMLPQWIEVIEKIPLLPNQKIDMNALPSVTLANQTKVIELPQNYYETKMVNHWQRLLDVQVIGLNDDFFEVGGSSIKLIELVYNLQSEFNITIAVSQLFKLSTLYGMAQTLENIIIGKEAGGKSYVAFNDDQEKLLFCFPPAGGHGLVYQRLAEQLFDYHFISFNYLSDTNKIDMYADLIESIDPKGPYNLFGYSLGGNLAFLVARELESRGNRINKLIMMDSYRISETFDFNNEHLAEFEKELSSHLLKHTGSQIVAKETLEQARSYIKFCSQTLNIGKLQCELDVISDENKLNLYAPSQKGSWYSSSSITTVHKGFGPHADMLDDKFVKKNARLTRTIIERA